MLKLLKYLKKFFISIIIVMFLVLVQTATDLSLPALMANIIDIGVLKGDLNYIVMVGFYMLLISIIGGVATISIGFFAAGLAAILGANLGVQIAVFAAVSTLLVLFTRPIAKRLTAHSPRKLFIDEILGSTGVVTEDVNASTGTGRVKVRGEEWRAYPLKNKEVIPKGSSVVVERVEGNIIYVRPLDESNEQEV